MKLLYVSSSVFPFGAAYSSRQTNFARLFYDIGIDVHIITDYTLDEKYELNTIQHYEDYTFEALVNSTSYIEKINLPHKCMKAVARYLETNKVDIVMSNASSDRYLKLRRYFKNRKIPFYLEIGEWRDSSNFKLANINPFYIRDLLAINNWYKKSDGIIAISRLLNDHYKKYVNNVLRIPTILDTKNTKYCMELNNAKLLIMYAGNPGKSKELLENIFLALQLMKADSSKIEFHIYGANKTQVLFNIGNQENLLNSLSNCVYIHGKVPQECMNDIYIQYDYSIFIRPSRRSSNAGFPTKLAESMAAGTPVITNSTGDISLYLESGRDGYLLDSSPEGLKQLFCKLILQDPVEKNALRKNARICAEKNFDYRNYKESINGFLQAIRYKDECKD